MQLKRNSYRIRQVTFIFSGFCFFVFPVVFGILGVLLPAFGYFPALGYTQFSITPAISFFNIPGVVPSIWLALSSGLIATFLSLTCSFIILIGLMHVPWFFIVRRGLATLVAVPHSAIAIGLVFLLAPSGWLIRIISPALTGFDRPPDLNLFPDSYGFGLMFGLMAKEIPFLLMISLAAISTMPTRQLEQISTSLGYGRLASWLLVIFPLIYKQIRLPLIAVLIFSLSVVDMALLLAPSLPPPLAILVLNGFMDAEITSKIPASFGALVQIGVGFFGLVVWLTGEFLFSFLNKFWRLNGWRLSHLDKFLPIIVSFSMIPLLTAYAGLFTALLWSVAGSWFFPDALPRHLHLMHWKDFLSYGSLIESSFYLATSASLISIFLALSWSYATSKQKLLKKWLLIFIFTPFFVPQISFLFGIQVSLNRFGLDGSWLALLWMHTIFILPYTWLIVIPAYESLDRRLDSVAATLGASKWRCFLKLHLPLMSYPIGTAFFVGISVSVAMYLPTIFVGAGRINTITVEAVSLAAGGSRGPAGVAAMLQIAIPVVSFIIIQAYLNYRFRRFSGMRSGGL